MIEAKYGKDEKCSIPAPSCGKLRSVGKWFRWRLARGNFCEDANFPLRNINHEVLRGDLTQENCPSGQQAMIERNIKPLVNLCKTMNITMFLFLSQVEMAILGTAFLWSSY